MTKSTTPPPSPAVQKFSKEATPEELLKFMVILCAISTSQNIVELNRFVAVVSRIIGPEDFSQLLRRTVKMMGDSKCGDIQCSDWLMTKLFDLYNTLGS